MSSPKQSPAGFLLAAGLMLSVPGVSQAADVGASAPESAPAAAPLAGPVLSRPLIKTIQPKTFLKAKRFELGLFAGGETINAYVKHYAGSLNATYHLTEVFAVEAYGGYSPTAPGTDLKDLTLELEQLANVRPSTTKMNWFGGMGIVFSPVYGKFAFLSQRTINFDTYLLAGVGLVKTTDLEETADGNLLEVSTTHELHPTTNLGLGFRAAVNPWLTFRLEGREHIFVETVTVGDSTNNQQALNLIYYFMAQAGVSILLPSSIK